MRIRELQKNNMSLLCNQAGFDFNCNYAANIYMYFVPLVEEGVKKGNVKTIFTHFNLLWQIKFANWNSKNSDSLREAPPKKNHVYLGIAEIAIWPPLLRKSGHFVAHFFAENEKIL